MNSRIQALVEQTGFRYDNGEWQFGDDSDVQKFAESIVRECASICELNGQSYTHSFTPAKARLAESTSNHCGLMIKKHFGVQ